MENTEPDSHEAQARVPLQRGVTPPLGWTREKPDKVGYYWYRNPPGSKPVIFRVAEFQHGLVVLPGRGIVANPDAYDGLWAGPIEPPPVAREAAG